MSTYNFGTGIPTWNGIPMISEGIPMFTGNRYFVDPVNGNDGNKGTSSKKALQTLYAAHNKCKTGNNDVVYLIGNGLSSGTARLSTALAQTISSSATTGTLSWTKDATHLVGITAPTGVSQRARIAPPATYTAATFGTNLVQITGSGCMFSNFSAYCGFSTNSATSHIGWLESGQRNFYSNVHFSGQSDTYSAVTSTTSACLKIDGGVGQATPTSGYGEHTFVGCTIGNDNVPKTGANASLIISGASPSNTFTNCKFLMTTTAAAPFFISIGVNGIDRWLLLDNCTFLNCIGSGATQITDLMTINASPGGAVFFRNPSRIGVLGISDDRTNVWQDGATPAVTTMLAAIPAA